MVNVRPLSKALARKATKELNEVSARVPEDIETLREWILKQPHLKTPLDDQFLITFLRGSKYSLQKAKEKLDLFFVGRELLPEVFHNRDPLDSVNAEIIKLGAHLPLPYPVGEDGPCVNVIRIASYDPIKYKFSDILKIGTLMVDIMMLENDNCIIGGTVGILDMANVTKDHFYQFELSLIKKLNQLSEEGQPFRQKGFHYINAPSSFETLFNVIKGFMSEKNKTRLYVHANIETLYQHVPKKYLPAEYGGDAGPIQKIVDHWEQKLLYYRNTILEWEKYGTNEKLRSEKSKRLDDVFGADGSFRRLGLD